MEKILKASGRVLFGLGVLAASSVACGALAGVAWRCLSYGFLLVAP